METLKSSETLIEGLASSKQDEFGGKFDLGKMKCVGESRCIDPYKVNRVESSSHVDVPIKGISLFVDLKGGVANKPDVEIRLPSNDNYLSYTKVHQGSEPVTGTALILKFSPNYPLPSSQDLNLVFCKYGELNELETRVWAQNFTGQVVFVNPSVAGDAINRFQNDQPFGPALSSYRVDHLYNVQSAVQVKRPVNKDLGVIKKNVEMMNMMLEKSGKSLSPEMRVKLESEIKGLMKKLSVMDGSFFSYFNNMQVPSPPPQVFFISRPLQQNMRFDMWNTPQPFGFQNIQGSSQGMAQNMGFERQDVDTGLTSLGAEIVPETQVLLGDNGGDKQKKKRAHKRKPPGEARLKTIVTPWSPNEEMNLAKAWLEITEDPKCGNYQRERTYWARILKLFLSLEEKSEGYRDADGISARWRKMCLLIQQFNQIYTRLISASARQSGANDAVVQANAQKEYQATHRSAFPYLAIWQILRRSSKFATVIAFDPMSCRGQPSAKRSKTSSSNDPQSQGWDARCQINLNETDKEYEDCERGVDPVEPLRRPIGRVRARKAGQSSLTGVRIDYTETFKKVIDKLDGLLQASRQRLNLKKKELDDRKLKLKLKESRQKTRDLQFLSTETSGLSGAELALAEQIKQEIRKKYNL